MTKQDIINKTTLAIDQSKVQTSEIINQAIVAIQEAVSNGLTVNLKGFRSLTPTTKKACERDKRH